jgi:hypothetical protein
MCCVMYMRSMRFVLCLQKHALCIERAQHPLCIVHAQHAQCTLLVQQALKSYPGCVYVARATQSDPVCECADLFGLRNAWVRVENTLKTRMEAHTHVRKSSPTYVGGASILYFFIIAKYYVSHISAADWTREHVRIDVLHVHNGPTDDFNFNFFCCIFVVAMKYHVFFLCKCKIKKPAILNLLPFCSFMNKSKKTKINHHNQHNQISNIKSDQHYQKSNNQIDDAENYFFGSTT